MTPVPAVLGAAVLGGALGPGASWLAQRLQRRRRAFGAAVHLVAALATALLFAAIVWRFGVQPAAVAYLALAAAGVALAIVDLRERRLPDRIVLPTAAAVALLLVVAALLDGRPVAALTTAGGAAGMFVVYLLLAVVTRNGIGMGDVKLALAVGAAAGYLGVTAWLLALALGFLFNGLAAVVALALRRTTLRGSLPFGPWMLLGVFAAAVLA